VNRKDGKGELREDKREDGLKRGRNFKHGNVCGLRDVPPVIHSFTAITLSFWRSMLQGINARGKHSIFSELNVGGGGTEYGGR